MLNRGRKLWLAALGSLILGAPALAQQTPQEAPPASGGVGLPSIRDFELRPDNQAAPIREPRPTIAPLPEAPASDQGQQQQPSASEPVVAITPPPAPVTRAPAAPPARQPVAEAAATNDRPAPSAETANSTETPPVSTDETDSAPSDIAPPPLGIETETAATLTPPALEPDESSGKWWIYLLFAGLVGGLGFVALRRKGRLEPALAAPAAAPVRRPEAPPAPKPAVSTARPWIDLEFRPSEAGTNATHALIKFELTVRNTGDGEARDVRIDGRLFNAGAEQDQEIKAYFGEGGNGGMPAPRPIAAKTQIPYRGTVLLPREQVREVTVADGRRLFIPMVAFNVCYKWGEAGSGQTSASYLVGSESDPPNGKMGAFRLDLGPRIYRKIGQREHRLRRRI